MNDGMLVLRGWALLGAKQTSQCASQLKLVSSFCPVLVENTICSKFMRFVDIKFSFSYGTLYPSSVEVCKSSSYA